MIVIVILSTHTSSLKYGSLHRVRNNVLVMWMKEIRVGKHLGQLRTLKMLDHFNYKEAAGFPSFQTESYSIIAKISFLPESCFRVSILECPCDIGLSSLFVQFCLVLRKERNYVSFLDELKVFMTDDDWVSELMFSPRCQPKLSLSI